MTQPLFSDEGPQYYAAAYGHNQPFARPGPYQTRLSPAEEQAFRVWVRSNAVPFDPDAQIADYDMRGFWKDTGGKWSGGHFPDTYKTPYDTTFSRESKYATPNCPFVWQGDNLVDTRNNQLIFGTPTAPARRQGGGPVAPGGPILRMKGRDGRFKPVTLNRGGEIVMRPGDQLWRY